jgi:hypothetical protein
VRGLSCPSIRSMRSDWIRARLWLVLWWGHLLLGVICPGPLAVLLVPGGGGGGAGGGCGWRVRRDATAQLGQQEVEELSCQRTSSISRQSAGRAVWWHVVGVGWLTDLPRTEEVFWRLSMTWRRAGAPSVVPTSSLYTWTGEGIRPLELLRSDGRARATATTLFHTLHLMVIITVGIIGRWAGLPRRTRTAPTARRAACQGRPARISGRWRPARPRTARRSARGKHPAPTPPVPTPDMTHTPTGSQSTPVGMAFGLALPACLPAQIIYIHSLSCRVGLP